MRGLAPLRIVGDAALAALALYAAFQLRIGVELPFTQQLFPADRIFYFERALPWLLAAQLALGTVFGLYEGFRPLPRLEMARRLLFVAGLQGVGGALAVFLAGASFPRSILLLYVLFDFVGLYLWRRLLEALHARRGAG